MSMFHELMMRKKVEIMYATIKGTLTENNGVFSMFKNTYYLILQQSIDFTKDFEFVIKYSFADTETNYANVFLGQYGSQQLQIRPGTAGTNLAFYYNGYSYNWNGINVANYTFFKLQKLGNVIKMYLGNSKDIWDISYTVNNSTWVNVNIENRIGQTADTNTTSTFSLDLPNSYIKLGATKYKIVAVLEE